MKEKINNILEKIIKKRGIIIEIIILIVISIFSFSITPKTLQNDTYYTVSIGNLILENGIDNLDHFSWHEDLSYTYPHWLYDVIMSQIYNLGESGNITVPIGVANFFGFEEANGNSSSSDDTIAEELEEDSSYTLTGWDTIYISTCVLAIILGITIYKVNKSLNKNKAVSFLVTIGALYLLRSYIAARAQLVTFILFTIVIYFIEKMLENPKKLQYAIGIIIISILIANLHVAVWPFLFVLSLPYIAEYIICVIGDIIIFDKAKIWYLKRKLAIKKRTLKNKNKKYKARTEEQINNEKEIDNLYELNEKNKKDNELIEKQIYEINEKLISTYELNEKRKKAKEQDKPYKIRSIRNKNVKWLIVVMIICAFTGFLTPLGDLTIEISNPFAVSDSESEDEEKQENENFEITLPVPYLYLYKTMIGNTTENINEHQPLTLIQNVPIMCTLIIIIALLTFTSVKIRLSDLFMIGGLTYLMFSSKRQSTMFALVGSIILNREVTEAISIYSTEKFKEFMWFITRVGVTIVIGIAVYLSVKNVKDLEGDKYVNTKSYPVAAADWILENLDVDNIKLFNEYNYGSYLLYRGIPVFIDSRADLYDPEFSGLEDDIFMDFINTSGISTYYGETFKKYGITHVIVFKNSKIAMLIDKADSEKYDKIYSDSKFVIYEVLQYDD